MFALGALHVFWAVRNRYTDSVMIPKVGGKPSFIPTRRSTVLVAVALFAGCTVALAQGHVIETGAPAWLIQGGAYVAGTMFALRSIGEFRLVGFFKRVRGTDFARWDTWLFSPLSALIGSAFLYLAQLPR